MEPVLRKQALGNALRALKHRDRSTGQPCALVLRFHIKHRKMPSHKQAKRLSALWGAAVTADWVRKWLGKARAAMAELLLAEAAELAGEDAGREDLAQTLIDLNLWRYCRRALKQDDASILGRSAEEELRGRSRRRGRR